MQVDYRERFTMSQQQLPETDYIRDLTSYAEFFGDKNGYAAAKREVANWLAEEGAGTLFGRLDRLKNGAPFAVVVEPGS